jgi:hypothetical protein
MQLSLYIAPVAAGLIWCKSIRSLLFYLGVAQSGSVLGLEPRGRRFKSCLLDHYNGLVAQSGERQPVTLEVVGSKPIKVATHGPVV